MKKSVGWLMFGIVGLSLLGACDEEEDKGTQNQCSVSVCKDSRILNVCDPVSGSFTHESVCPNGCDLVRNICISGTYSGCTQSVCVDDKTLSTCNVNTGISRNEICKYGCDLARNACKLSEDPQTGTGCTNDFCKDADTLLICDVSSGTTSEYRCPIGCDQNADVCKTQGQPGCTADICLDAETLRKCDVASGASTDYACPNGCDLSANACKPQAQCTANRCKDADTLLVCDVSSGTASEYRCPIGCDQSANACKTQTQCTANRCKDADTLLICDVSSGTSSEYRCPNGCDQSKNACKNLIYPGCKADTCKDDKILLSCDTKTGKTSEKECEGKCRDNSCVASDWCDSHTDCQDAAKPYCNLSTHQCSKDAACEQTFCGTNETCSHGLCVPNADFNAMSKDECQPQSFVEHCRTNPDGRDLVYSCVKKNDAGEYYVGVQYCSSKKCAVYEDESFDRHAVCVEPATTGSCQGSFVVCEEYNSGQFEVEAWLLTYTCAKSIAGADIVYLSKMYGCGEGYECYGNSCY